MTSCNHFQKLRPKPINSIEHMQPVWIDPRGQLNGYGRIESWRIYYVAFSYLLLWIHYAA